MLSSSIQLVKIHRHAAPINKMARWDTFRAVLPARVRGCALLATSVPANNPDSLKCGKSISLDKPVSPPVSGERVVFAWGRLPALLQSMLDPFRFLYDKVHRSRDVAKGHRCLQ